MRVRLGILIAAAFMLASCQQVSDLLGESKPTAGDLGLSWTNPGLPVNASRFEADRQACLLVARRKAPDGEATADSRFTAAFDACFRSEGYRPRDTVTVFNLLPR